MTRNAVVRMAVAVALGLAALGPARAAPDEPLGFTVIPRYNPMLMVQNYQPIVDYLNTHTPYRFRLVMAKDYNDAVELLRSREAVLASLGAVTFIQAYRTCGAVPLVRPRNAAGRAEYRSIIIVRADSELRTLDDLRGRRFAFGSHHSTSGNLIPRAFLARHGILPEDLGSWVNLGKHDAVAKAVLKGQVDAGAVKDVIAVRYREHGLRFLASSEPIPAVPVVAHPETPAAVRQAVREALLAVDPDDPAQRTALESWDPEFCHGFVTAAVEDYRPVAQIVDRLEDTCAGDCHQ